MPLELSYNQGNAASTQRYLSAVPAGRPNTRLSRVVESRCSLVVLGVLLVTVILLVAYLVVSSKAARTANAEALLTIKSTAERSCHDGWIRGTGDLGRNCYLFSENTEALNWVQSDEFCRRFGSVLVTIHSASEKDFIVSHLSTRLFPESSRIQKASYTGLTVNSDRSAWRWADTFSTLDTAAINWNEGEPNNHGGSEYCTNLFVLDHQPAGVLNDVNCEELPFRNIQFVCKYSLMKENLG